MARHRFDLRGHAAIMLCAAVLIAYFGFRLWTMDIVMVSDKPVRIVTPPDLMSYWVLAISFAIAAICLFEAFRSWQEAASARHEGPTRRSPYPMLLPTAIEDYAATTGATIKYLSQSE
ncbi:MAG TPA: hypothetical protein VH020_08895 [Stellaceae bacterium]|nr:hypothetical protein [Stellaceae bacterium]